MTVAARLGLVLGLGVVVFAGAAGAMRVERELALIEEEARTELLTIGASLRPAFVHSWSREGPDAALALLDHAASELDESRRVRLRWVPLGDPSVQALTSPERLRLAAGRPVEQLDSESSRVRLLLPLDAGLPPGALELVRPLQREREFIDQSVRNVVVSTVSIAVLMEVVVLLAGRWLVGRPLGLLADQARRIGAGDLDARLAIRAGAEIDTVVREMNAMAEALEQSRLRVADEHSARVAALEELRHADRLATVGKLAAGVAHELGTPLTVVTHHAKQIALHSPAGGEPHEGAQVIVRQVEKLTVIVRQLLAFARRGSGIKRRGDVASLAKQTLELLAPMAQKRGVTVSFAGPASVQEADFEPHQLEQALTNLVVNGLQAMKAGGRLKVAVDAERAAPPAATGLPAGDYVGIAVEDDGAGISAEALPKVFDPFFTTKPVGEGTGLGLSVAYGIARDHGGWIDASSTPGVGSRFVLHLPRAPANG